ncbi:uncharacterized protein AB675_4885 [Cyphellophora attinorum]|uniref:Srp40 C-terminal domain-containing protein n=1 Tax=Cyphellophora attinorum TaxID=1664694 RepID=A0A0N1NW27_9EURO|nr:uncharacterized protein AB675_4885 [Phialophora attinorum]KPI34830.1 hypothetical protein AB675_4885 [Phialophora attinorum]
MPSKTAPKAESDDSSTSGSSTSSEGENDSSSSSDEEMQDAAPITQSAPKQTDVAESDVDGRAGSSSSGTVIGEKKPSPEVDSDIHPSRRGQMMNGTRKHEGARPTPLAQQSALANEKDFLSNKYVSYDYADRAYKDLSVTRGKGFTKEKNKKKRGSYRGGMIDISGGKGFKFDD